MIKNIHLKSEKVDLIKVDKSTLHINILYKFLKKRSIYDNISHTSLPNYQQHRLFVNTNPYRYWFLIFFSKKVIGSAYVSRLNEISIKIEKNNLVIYKETLKLLIENLKPLKEIPSQRSKHFVINVSPKNKNLINLLSKMGLQKIQETYTIKNENEKSI